MTVRPSAFGSLLRKWRTTRHLSQERLASESEISPRHLSCLETARATPSREMVLVLTSALELPLRDRNALLRAAGFADAYRESPLDAKALASVRHALDFVLAGAEPNGAIVCDRLWNVTQSNLGAARMMAAIYEGATPANANVLHAIFAPGPLRSALVNWEQIAGGVIERLQREIAAAPDDTELAALHASLLDQPDVPRRFKHEVLDAMPPFIPLHFRVRGGELRFFTMITTLGTPLDVTAQDIRIETYFPADPATERWVRDASDRSS